MTCSDGCEADLKVLYSQGTFPNSTEKNCSPRGMITSRTFRMSEPIWGRYKVESTGFVQSSPVPLSDRSVIET